MPPLRGPDVCPASLCIVVGDAPEKFADLEDLWEIGPGHHEVCCVNRAGLWFPCEFRFWVSFHADELAGWASARSGPELWSTREHQGVLAWPVDLMHGSSAMVAAQYALGVWGFERVVLVGCPMNGAYRGYFQGWAAMKANHGQRIRSMSGNTAELFGRPDAEFLGAV